MAHFQSHENDELVRPTSGYRPMSDTIYLAEEICFSSFGENLLPNIQHDSLSLVCHSSISYGSIMSS
jgi:hypothetical protein